MKNFKNLTTDDKFAVVLGVSFTLLVAVVLLLLFTNPTGTFEVVLKSSLYVLIPVASFTFGAGVSHSLKNTRIHSND